MPLTLWAWQAKENSGLEDAKNSHLLQAVHELIVGSSVYDAFVAAFVGEDCQPGN